MNVDRQTERQITFFIQPHRAEQRGDKKYNAALFFLKIGKEKEAKFRYKRDAKKRLTLKDDDDDDTYNLIYLGGIHKDLVLFEH